MVMHFINVKHIAEDGIIFQALQVLINFQLIMVTQDIILWLSIFYDHCY